MAHYMLCWTYIDPDGAGYLSPFPFSALVSVITLTLLVVGLICERYILEFSNNGLARFRRARDYFLCVPV